jgi:hypothetical protein
MTAANETNHSDEPNGRQEADSEYLGNLSVDQLVDVHRSIVISGLGNLGTHLEVAIDRTLIGRPEVLLEYVNRLIADERAEVRLVGYQCVDEVAAVDKNAARLLWVQWLEDPDEVVATVGVGRMTDELSSASEANSMPMEDIFLFVKKVADIRERRRRTGP